MTDFPVPESLPILEKLQAYEPVAMRGQPPVVWDRAEGFQVYDAWGNQWIDWSSGVLITNAGHGRREIVDAIARQAQSQAADQLLLSRARSARGWWRSWRRLLPEPLKKVFLLTTGSETVECAIKLCRSHGAKAGGRAQERDRLVRQSLSRPHARVAAGGRHPGAERMDRQPGSRLRADPVSRRIPHRRHFVRRLSNARCASTTWSRRTSPA